MRRQRKQFIRAVCSVATSTLGSRAIGITYPLLALSVTQSPMLVGWVTFALTVPGLLFYMPAGVLADRTDPRSIMLFTETVRGLAVLSVLGAIAIGQVTAAHIIVAAFVEGALWVTYSLAETALFSTLISPNSAPALLATAETGVHFAVLAGRPLGGLFFGLGQLWAFLLNAGIFALSSAFLSGEAHTRKPRRQRFRVLKEIGRGVRQLATGPLSADMVSGFRELCGHLFLRRAMLVTAVTNLAINTVIIIFMAESIGLSSILVGLVLAAGGIGGAIGSSLARLPSIQRLFKPESHTLYAQLWIWVLALFIATWGEPASYAIATVLTGCTGALVNVSIRTYEIRSVDRQKLARVVSVHRLMAHGAVCLAAPLGGLLAARLTAQQATAAVFWVTVAFAAVTSVAMVMSRLGMRRRAAQPGRALS
ncbi:MFS transporter [Acrocarpospora pleiomorpha]|uniref:MFS transporter n=1 Tax=Acrocarpospora pleiomorpha TaxID=90975 RepID=A0A5M3XP18_9ACTN|nr:MFS transporter [Acrocarpospora pleiomorpha]GES21391.1 MFS transporter [Acrocarpospora pleiomorpha]